MDCNAIFLSALNLSSVTFRLESSSGMESVQHPNRLQGLCLAERWPPFLASEGSRLSAGRSTRSFERRSHSVGASERGNC